MTSASTPQLELWIETTEPATVPPSEVPAEATWQTWFSTWLAALAPTESPINHYEVSLLLTNDAGIQQLNASYRQQDRATDVLAFAAQETEMPGTQTLYQTEPFPLGDIIISVETAQRQRHDASYSLRQELAWLAAHGLLHLLGWDHPDAASLANMLREQTSLLKQIELMF